MNNYFSFQPVPKICFGPGKISELTRNIQLFGNHCLFVFGRSSFLRSTQWQTLEKQLTQENIRFSYVQVVDEPTPENIDAIVAQFKNTTISVVVAIGGGSVLDSGKAVAAILTEKGTTINYLEGVGTKKPTGTTIPFIAVPTTSGTGSETTSNSVITKTGENGFKKSLRHINYIPDIALVDPELTLGCPACITATCGMDCYSQLIEGYLSTNATTLTDSLVIEAIQKVSGSLQQSCLQPTNLQHRTNMSYGAMISGIVLTNAGLGLVHGVAPILGSLYSIPHGAACGMLMAEANRMTLHKLRSQKSDSTALHKYTLLGKITSEQSKKSDAYYQDSFINSLFKLQEQLEIPNLSAFSFDTMHVHSIAYQASSKYNPIPFETEEICTLITQC